MNKEMSLLRDIMLLKDEAFATFRSLPNVLELGLLIIICISLLVGMANSVESLLGSLTTVPQTREEIKQEMRQRIEENVRFDQIASEETALIWPSVEPIVDMIFDISELPRPLGQAPGAVLTWARDVLNSPLRQLARWAFFTLLTLIVAKAMGGRADLRTMLGCTALSFLPGALNILGSVPWLGGLASFVAWVWGTAILVKATAAANDLSLTQGFFAVILPRVILIGLGLLAIPFAILSTIALIGVLAA